MRSVLASVSLCVSVILICFFTVFAFHASTPTQHTVKTYLESGQGSLPFSEDANYHMRDVFVLISVARVLAVIALLSLFVVWRDLSSPVVFWTACALIALPLVLAVLPWQVVFEVFHEVFFPQGNWRFPYESLIIQTYPARFFVVFSASWGLLIVLLAAALLLLRNRFSQ